MSIVNLIGVFTVRSWQNQSECRVYFLTSNELHLAFIITVIISALTVVFFLRSY